MPVWLNRARIMGSSSSHRVAIVNSNPSMESDLNKYFPQNMIPQNTHFGGIPADYIMREYLNFPSYLKNPAYLRKVY